MREGRNAMDVERCGEMLAKFFRHNNIDKGKALATMGLLSCEILAERSGIDLDSSTTSLTEQQRSDYARDAEIYCSIILDWPKKIGL